MHNTRNVGQQFWEFPPNSNALRPSKPHSEQERFCGWTPAADQEEGVPSLGAAKAIFCQVALWVVAPKHISDPTGRHFGTLGAPFGEPGLHFGVCLVAFTFPRNPVGTPWGKMPNKGPFVRRSVVAFGPIFGQFPSKVSRKWQKWASGKES